VCIVLDANVFASVFSVDSALHHQFKPVLDWITKKGTGGRVVFGGTKYKRELAEAPKYRRIFLQLKNAGRAVEINQDRVDARETELLMVTRGTDCDDQHLIAILCVSGCMLVCSLDRRAYCHIRNRHNYRGRRKVPKIYNSARHRRLLHRGNVVELRNVA